MLLNHRPTQLTSATPPPSTPLTQQVTLHMLLMARDTHLLATLLGTQLPLIIGETNTLVMGTNGCNHSLLE